VLGGYIGKVLRVNLTEEKTSIQTFSEETLRKYIGGSGLGARILYDETDERTDPLGPENLLIFMIGPLVGTRALNFGRHQVVTKSPLTGGYGEANSGGSWGTNLKRAGYDGIVFTGRAKKPVYIYINNGEVQIRDASHLWGKDTYEVDSVLKRELGEKIVTCSIGQGGENLIKFASIMNDGVEGRAAGRCGVGAVMGSKNLKAIAVVGSIQPYIVEEDKLKASIKKWVPIIRNNTDSAMGQYGTSCGLTSNEALGNLPVKNWGQGKFTEGARKICGQAMAEAILTKRYYCSQCVIGCGRTVHVKEGPFAGVEGGGPEYETLGMMGSNCLVDNIEAIAKANELCNRYGIDTISTGSTIAFAMECYEKGIITKDQLGGLELKWGDPHAMVEMVTKIAFREDIAYILAEGTRTASQKLGGLASEFAIHVRGQEFPAHDPRACYSTGLEYATSPRGACHLSSFSHDFEFGAGLPKDFDYEGNLNRFDISEKHEYVAKMQNIMSMFDSLTGCKFVLFGLGDETVTTITDWLNMVTGWNMTVGEFMQTGERIFTLKRMYNIRLGQSRKDDILPPRTLSQKRGEGGAADTLPHLGQLLNEYYKYRGWDETGIPKQETLEKLGLG